MYFISHLVVIKNNIKLRIFDQLFINRHDYTIYSYHSKTNFSINF